MSIEGHIYKNLDTTQNEKEKDKDKIIQNLNKIYADKVVRDIERGGIGIINNSVINEVLDNLEQAAELDLTPEESGKIINLQRTIFSGFTITNTFPQDKVHRRANTVRKLNEKINVTSDENEYSKEKVFSDFKKFAAENKDFINSELKAGKTLSDIFYYNFYNTDINNRPFNENNIKILIENLTQSQIKLTQEIYNDNKRRKNIEFQSNIEWKGVKINGGVSKNNNIPIGRVYINCKPARSTDIFKEAIERFLNSGISMEIKMPAFYPENLWDTMGIKETDFLDKLNRFDKIIIYFNENDEQKLLEIIENLYNKNEKYLNTEVPKFTTNLKAENGTTMKGISFGENPPKNLFKNISFGDLRSQILAQVYEDAEKSGFEVSDEKFNFKESFRKACKIREVDPNNPAFNLSENKINFQEIRKRALY